MFFLQKWVHLTEPSKNVIHCFVTHFLPLPFTGCQRAHTHTHTLLLWNRELIMTDFVVTLCTRNRIKMECSQFNFLEFEFHFLGKFPIWLQCPSISCLVTLLMTDVITRPPDSPVLFLKKFSDIKNGNCCFIGCFRYKRWQHIKWATCQHSWHSQVTDRD